MVVLPAWVQQRNGFWQLLGGQVVIGNHQLNAQLCGQVSFLNGGNAVIHCHNQLIAFICQLLQGFTVQAVAAASRVGSLQRTCAPRLVRHSYRMAVAETPSTS